MKKILFLLIAGAVFFVLSSCYYYDVTKGQLTLTWEKIPVEEALQSEDWQKYQPLLQHVAEIRSFGINQVQLKNTPNFVDVYRTPGPGVTHVLTAAPKLSLKPYKWEYFWVGSLPFRGYFSEDLFQENYDQLVQQDLDVWSFYSTAYSTLGWFRDPITTPMLNNGLLSLAESILHEMVHETLYVRNASDLNEQLASFVGHQAALDYVRTLPNGEEMIAEREKGKKSAEQYRKIFFDAYQAAKAIYDAEQPDEIKFKEREKLFTQTQKLLAELYPGRSQRFYEINNARLLQWSRYNEQDDFFVDLWAQADEQWENFWHLLPQALLQEKNVSVAEKVQ